MPKRKKTEDVDYLSRKIKKFERKLQRAKRRISESDSSIEESLPPVVEDTTVLDILEGSPIMESEPGIPVNDKEPEQPITDVPDPAFEQPATSSMDIDTSIEPEDHSNTVIDPEILEILGIDPTQKEAFGKNIHAGLALRLEHIATNGLSKETRKELNEKYLIPANCTKICAPTMNPEIRAAVTEVVMKRDKGLEARQKQLASAIAGLAGVLSQELEAKEKDNNRLKQLMDVCRILGDIQHSESATRRNFAIFSIKRDLKEHISNTKIDRFLFGENLAETLKTAKAVTKSGTELKTKAPVKPKPTTTATHLNWKSPAPARKTMAPPRNQPITPRAQAPGPHSRPNRNMTRVDPSRPLQHQFKQNLRR